MMTLPPRTAREHRSEAVLVPAFLFLAGTILTIALDSDRKVAYLSLHSLQLATTLQILFWWAMFLIRSSRAASPLLLQLLPGFRLQTTIATSLSWLVLSAVLTTIFAGMREILLLIWLVAFGLMFRHPARRRVTLIVGGILWLLFCFVNFATEWSPLGRFEPPGLARAALLWGAAASLLGVLGIQCLYRWLGTVLFVIYFISASGTMLPGSSLWNVLYLPRAVAHPEYAFTLTAAGILMFGLIMHRLTVRRGDRAIERCRRDGEMRSAMTSPIDSNAKANWSLMKTPSIKAAAQVEQHIAAQSDIRKLIALAFGPSLHGFREIKIHLLAIGAMILMTQFMQLSKYYHASMTSRLFLLFPFVLMIGPMVLPNLIRRSHREQALLAVSPHWLAPQILNRWLVRHVAARIAVSWAFSMLCLFALTWLHTLPADLVLRTVITLTLFSLFLFGYNLQDYAHAVLDGGRSLGVALAELAVPSIIALLVFLPESAFTSTMIIGGVFACFIGWRLVRTLKGAATLPAGRLAKSST